MNIELARIIVSEAQHRADATPEKLSFMPEQTSQDLAEIEEARDFITAYDAMKVVTHSKSYVLFELSKLVLEIAPDSPQKQKCQAIFEAFSESSVASAILDPE